VNTQKFFRYHRNHDHNHLWRKKDEIAAVSLQSQREKKKIGQI